SKRDWSSDVCSSDLLTEFIERISALREEFPPLTHGDFEMLGSDEGMSVFKRTYQDESIYVAINNDSESRSLSIESLGEDKQLRRSEERRVGTESSEH